ncbi:MULTISPECIES: hypothetical protein [unclassified Ruegeria]|uniref:hypothetical protein n=1 Tax=unclassified Ruegeria TaxID=2625375 RepID=UPI001489B46F|nr:MULTISPECIES: hypothetical protein [unclassified Ruegeria]NOD78330.1 hypothetical protein [Ruegeria sp. HKCCD4332]NOG10839.1 hypothetical protein [Ruegeria sp. HKCCD4315]
MTWELSDELPELSDALSGRIETDALLSEAIADLKKVTALLDDTSITAPERAEWAHIRSELVNELRRMVKRNLRNTFN